MFPIDIVAFWDLFCCLSGIGVFISFVLYLTPIIYLSFIARPQNLREKYGDWAVVTGGSSGIGKAVVRRLAQQGVNVCIVALDDGLLKETYSQFRKEFRDVEFRAIPVDLGCNPSAYMKAIHRGTADVRVSILINNAGFLLMGFFEKRDADIHLCNVECNALAAIRLTHYFYKRMIRDDIKGCITFTSSAAWFMVSLFSFIRYLLLFD